MQFTSEVLDAQRKGLSQLEQRLLSLGRTRELMQAAILAMEAVRDCESTELDSTGSQMPVAITPATARAAVPLRAAGVRASKTDGPSVAGNFGLLPEKNAGVALSRSNSRAEARAANAEIFTSVQSIIKAAGRFLSAAEITEGLIQAGYQVERDQVYSLCQKRVMSRTLINSNQKFGLA